MRRRLVATREFTVWRVTDLFHYQRFFGIDCCVVIFGGGGFADRIHNVCLADETLFAYDRIDVRLCEPNRSCVSWLVSFE